MIEVKECSKAFGTVKADVYKRQILWGLETG